jgi:hypothetical protein
LITVGLFDISVFYLAPGQPDPGPSPAAQSNPGESNREPALRLSTLTKVDGPVPRPSVAAAVPAPAREPGIPGTSELAESSKFRLGSEYGPMYILCTYLRLVGFADPSSACNFKPLHALQSLILLVQ